MIEGRKTAITMPEKRKKRIIDLCRRIINM